MCLPSLAPVSPHAVTSNSLSAFFLLLILWVFFDLGRQMMHNIDCMSFS